MVFEILGFKLKKKENKIKYWRNELLAISPMLMVYIVQTKLYTDIHVELSYHSAMLMKVKVQIAIIKLTGIMDISRCTAVLCDRRDTFA